MKADLYCLGNIPQAITILEKSRDLAQSIGYKKGEGEAVGNLGNVYDQNKLQVYRKRND